MMVFAVDLWISATENYNFYKNMGLDDQIILIYYDALSLPFAEKYFDALVSVDAYPYFGCNESYYDEYISKYLKNHTQVAIGVPGMKYEVHKNVADEMKKYDIDKLRSLKLNKINFEEKFKLFNDRWSPKIIAQMNDYHFKLVKIKGDFTWHKHDETDETFIVIKGQMKMQYEDNDITLNEGEMIVVPKGKIHKPFSKNETKLLVIEPVGTLNTGDKKDEYTKEKVDWI